MPTGYYSPSGQDFITAALDCTSATMLDVLLQTVMNSRCLAQLVRMQLKCFASLRLQATNVTRPIAVEIAGLLLLLLLLPYTRQPSARAGRQ